jgi:hypothetical protein
MRFLRHNNWTVKQNKIRWTDKAMLTTTLRALAERSYSRQWNLTDEVHEKAMLRARAITRTLHARGMKSEELQQELLICVATRR